MEAKLFINGEWLATPSTISVENPATKQIIGTAPNGGATEAKLAADAASLALQGWKSKTAYERAAIIGKWHQLIHEHTEEIASIMTKEQGKPLQEAIGEVAYANSFLAWYAEEGKRIYGQTIPASSSNKRIIVQQQPVGVVAAITPWNFPAAMITRKAAPALAAGCTVVVKPSELTPFTAYKLAELASEAGMPNGVFNVITGKDSEIGETWMTDARVRKLTFTGSTQVGKLLMQQAATSVKKLSLELGGQAPFIVAEHADLSLAVEQLMLPKFRNAGQTCISPNRIYVHECVMEKFISQLEKAMEMLKVGNGMEAGVQVGPLIAQHAVDKVNKQIEDALKKGALLKTFGNAPNETGYFVQPALLIQTTDEMLCMREETFGPIIPISSYMEIDEVIARANNSEYGLAAYVFSENIKEATTIVEGLEYGIIGLNDGLPSTAQAPFGGMKESGLGREGGHWGIEEFLEVKYISIQI